MALLAAETRREERRERARLAEELAQQQAAAEEAERLRVERAAAEKAEQERIAEQQEEQMRRDAQLAEQLQAQERDAARAESQRHQQEEAAAAAAAQRRFEEENAAAENQQRLEEENRTRIQRDAELAAALQAQEHAGGGTVESPTERPSSTELSTATATRVHPPRHNEVIVPVDTTAFIAKVVERLVEIEDLVVAAGAERFVDSDFTPTHINSTGGAIGATDGWAVPSDIYDGAPWPLFPSTKLQADAVEQGALGDCWLISAIGVLTGYKDGALCRALFPGQGPGASNSGAYIVRFCRAGRWKAVILDPLMPYRGGGRYMKELAFCSPNESAPALWGLLIEKAYAKASGGYERLVGGTTNEALQLLTGWPTKRMNLDDPDLSSDEIWAILLSADSSGYLMTVSTIDSRPACSEVGLRPSHAYQLLSVSEVRRSVTDTKMHKLVRVRNPHGHGEWSGDWSDRSSLWTPELRAEFSYPPGNDDGTFFIPFESLRAYFDTVCSAFRCPRI